MRRRLTFKNIVLVLSLALNGLLITYVAVSFGVLHTAFHGGPQGVLTKLAERLPEQDGDALRAALRKHEAKLDRSTGALREHRMALGRILEKPEVDVEQLRALLAQAKLDRVDAADAFIAVFEDALPNVSLKTRRKLARFLQKEH